MRVENHLSIRVQLAHVANDSSGVPEDYRVGRHVLCHDSPSSDEGVVSDSDSRDEGHVRPNLHIVFDGTPLGFGGFRILRPREPDVRTHETGRDENTVANRCIFANMHVGVEAAFPANNAVALNLIVRANPCPIANLCPLSNLGELTDEHIPPNFYGSVDNDEGR